MSTFEQIILTLNNPGSLSVDSFNGCTTNETSPSNNSVEPPTTSPKKRRNLDTTRSDSFNSSNKKGAKSVAGSLRNTIKHMVVTPKENIDYGVPRSDQNESYDQFVDLDDFSKLSI